MPLTPTPGADALAAGMQLVPGTAPASDLDEYINQTRDYIAQRTSAVTPITKGGTGATSAANARTALGVPSTDSVCLRNGLGFPMGVAQISAHQIGLYYNDGAGRFAIRKSLNGNTDDTALASEAMLNGVEGAKVNRAGDTITGNLYLPNSSPATAGYAVAYINNDGRVSRGASSERYKKYISDIDPASLGDIFPQLTRFQMRGGDPGAWKYGYIAERLAENDDTEPFVVYNQDDEPETIDFIALLIAQNAQLHQAVDLLTQRLDALEGR